MMWPKPSPRMKAAYLIHHFACASAVFWSSLLLPLVPGAAPYVVTLVWLAVTAYYVWWVKRYYESKAYYIDEDYVTVEKGVFFSVVQRVLISKIHLVSLSMGLISRLLGLATRRVRKPAPQPVQGDPRRGSGDSDHPHPWGSRPRPPLAAVLHEGIWPRPWHKGIHPQVLHRVHREGYRARYKGRQLHGRGGRRRLG
ncbi:hypothetical protein B6U99_01910 [Candidatus Geothermarchaeota archaeon ex4572_27]|nr:MAG: hypothetical protein B6U99_01910 [Candidatus Geothermarchaeota archaeon ex4572_27]